MPRDSCDAGLTEVILSLLYCVLHVQFPLRVGRRIDQRSLVASYPDSVWPRHVEFACQLPKRDSQNGRPPAAASSWDRAAEQGGPLVARGPGAVCTTLCNALPTAEGESSGGSVVSAVICWPARLLEDDVVASGRPVWRDFRFEPWSQPLDPRGAQQPIGSCPPIEPGRPLYISGLMVEHRRGPRRAWRCDYQTQPSADQLQHRENLVPRPRLEVRRLYALPRHLLQRRGPWPSICVYPGKSNVCPSRDGPRVLHDRAKAEQA